MSLESDYLGFFEDHSPEGIRDVLRLGASPTALIKGKRPIDCLIGGYLRSDRFGACLSVLLDAGATVGDPLLEALLLDDASALRKILHREPVERDRRLSIATAFTPCKGVTPLHICAEFNSLRCARELLDAGADVNAAADLDANGFGGQPPLFHTVNSILNYCRPMMELLVEAGANHEIKLKGLMWGEGMDWETLVLDVTPVSYAQCGLYAQFHRAEQDVYSNLRYLYQKRYGQELLVRNVPNKYLSPKR
jgi:hypothetical protein